MILTTWGEADDHGGRSMAWTDLGAELEAQLGIPPVSIFAVAARYGMVLDLEANRFAIPDVAALSAKLKIELRPTS